MIQEFDLHTHTINSDGEYTTKQLVQKIRESNIKTFAISDHDSIKSINDMKEIDLTGLNYIKAIEISSILDGEYKMHILGYNIDEENEQLLEIINNLKQKRIKRIYDIKDCLKEQYNITLKDEEIENVIKEHNIPGRVHIAKLLIKNNYVKTVPEAFDKYLDDIKTTIIAREDATKVIKAIKNAGGIAIWAHSKKTEKQHNINMEEILPNLISQGLEGIEAYNSLHTYEESQRYLEIAKKYNILVSGGSDYHGPIAKPNVLLGKIYKDNENYKVPKEQITLLKKLNIK